MSQDLAVTSAVQAEEESDFLAYGGAYMIPPQEIHPATFALDLLQLPDFADLVAGEARIDWLLKRDEKTRGGRQVLGTAHMPKVQGDLNPCFRWMLASLFRRDSDFLIILDKSYWLDSSARLREILVFHELSHCIHKRDKFGDLVYDMDERPVWALKGHDVEEFTSVVKRYGAWNDEIKQFCAAVAAHSETT